MQLSFSQKLDLSKFSLSFQKMQKLSVDDDKQMKRQNCLKIKFLWFKLTLVVLVLGA